MLKLAIYYENLGRNDGNPLYVTSHLKRAQFYADQIVTNPINQSLLQYCIAKKDDDLAMKTAQRIVKETGDSFKIDHLAPRGDLHIFGDYDYHIWVDWGEDALKDIMNYTPDFPEGKVIYWASDTHLGHDYRLKMAKKAYKVYVAQKNAVDSFKKEGVDAEWLPHAFEPLAYPKIELASKKTDICFIGNVNSDNRMDMLDRAFKEFPNFYYGQKRFEEAARKFAESRVCLNIAMKDDLNMRCFEIAGSGNLLVTDKIQSIDDIFEDGKHYLSYKNLDEMVEKVKYALDNEDKMQEIRENAYKHCIENHTIYHRVNKMLDKILGEVKNGCKPVLQAS